MTDEPYDDDLDPEGELVERGPSRFERWVDGRRARRAEAAEQRVDVPPPEAPGVLVRAADHHVVSPNRARQVAQVYVPPMLRAAAWSPLTLPLWLLRQCWYMLRGMGAVLTNRREWIRQPERRQGLRAEGIDPTKREELRLEIEQRGAGRNRTWTLCAVVILGTLVAVAVWQVWLALALVLGGAARLNYMGRQPIGDEPAPEQPLAPSRIRTGISLGAVRSNLIEGALALGFEMTAQQPRPFVKGEGFDVKVQTQHELDPATLRSLERQVQVPENSISLVVDASDASVRLMRITLSDPLADMHGRPEPGFDSCSVRDAAELGLDETGRPYRERFERAHVQIVGKSGSGKSSALWWFLRLVSSWYDATADGIDLTRGPAFSALRGVLTRRAFTYEDAVALLRERKAEAEGRIAELGRMADSDDEVYDDADENWQPTPEAPQRYIAFDEFHSFVMASAAQAARDGNRSSPGEGVELVEWFLRYSRKAAVNLVLSGQGSKATDFGTSTIRDLITIAILFACDSTDVLRTLGKDARDAGWRPDLLLPAQGSNVRDAGKCHTMSAENDDSGRRRIFRLSLGEVRRFAREYRRYLGDADPAASDVDEAVVVPNVLQAVLAIADENGHPERVPSALVAQRLGWTQTQVAEQMRPYGLASARERCALADGRAVASYRVAEVQAAVDRL